MRTSNSLWFKIFATVFMFASLSVSADHHAWGPELGTALPEGLMVKTHEGKMIDVGNLNTIQVKGVFAGSTPTNNHIISLCWCGSHTRV